VTILVGVVVGVALVVHVVLVLRLVSPAALPKEKGANKPKGTVLSQCYTVVALLQCCHTNTLFSHCNTRCNTAMCGKIISIKTR
jgi:ribosomal protein S27E